VVAAFREISVQLASGTRRRLRRRWPGVSGGLRPWEAPAAARRATLAGTQIKTAHTVRGPVQHGGRLPRRMIVPLPAVASMALPTVASRAIGCAGH
jgi:hypothetical protein